MIRAKVRRKAQRVWRITDEIGNGWGCKVQRKHERRKEIMPREHVRYEESCNEKEMIPREIRLYARMMHVCVRHRRTLLIVRCAQFLQRVQARI